jgi:hypothetical protein
MPTASAGKTGKTRILSRKRGESESIGREWEKLGTSSAFPFRSGKSAEKTLTRHFTKLCWNVRVRAQQKSKKLKRREVKKQPILDSALLCSIAHCSILKYRAVIHSEWSPLMVRDITAEDLMR